MYRKIAFYLLIIVLAACGGKTEREISMDTQEIEESLIEEGYEEELQEKSVVEEALIRVDFQELLVAANIPDSLELIENSLISGDFNADGREDYATLVKNINNGFQGVMIIHQSQPEHYALFGAGVEIDGKTNLNWIDIFKSIPKGEIVAPTIVDEESGDIIGDDESMAFKLIGNGIYMHVDEACGGGILFWNGAKYEWYHIE